MGSATKASVSFHKNSIYFCSPELGLKLNSRKPFNEYYLLAYLAMFHEGSDSTIATDYFTEMCGITGQPSGRSNWPFITNYGDFTMMSDWSYLMTSFTVQVSLHFTIV